jgi:hypothetical protein
VVVTDAAAVDELAAVVVELGVVLVVVETPPLFSPPWVVVVVAPWYTGGFGGSRWKMLLSGLAAPAMPVPTVNPSVGEVR